MTVVAYKGKEGVCLERNQAVIYKGPFSSARDDDGHLYKRGERTAVCDKTFKILTSGPYRDMFIPVNPLEEIPLEKAESFDCKRDALRSPRQTKGMDYRETRVSDGGACDTESGCC